MKNCCKVASSPPHRKDVHGSWHPPPQGNFENIWPMQIYNKCYVSLSNDKREQEHDSSFSSWCCSSGGSCQHSQKNKWRLFTQLEKVVNCSHKLGPEDPWTLVYIWRVYRGKILTDNHVGLSIIGTLSDPVWVMMIRPSLDGLPSMMPIKRTSITSRR